MQRRWRSPLEPKKRGVAVALGWLSIGLGVAELFAGRRLARALGMENKTKIVRVFGIREIVSGISILASTRARPWLWIRVAGDLLDLGVLAPALSPRNRRRDRVAIALASVFGVTLLDLASSAREQ